LTQEELDQAEKKREEKDSELSPHSNEGQIAEARSGDEPTLSADGGKGDDSGTQLKVVQSDQSGNDADHNEHTDSTDNLHVQDSSGRDPKEGFDARNNTFMEMGMVYLLKPNVGTLAQGSKDDLEGRELSEPNATDRYTDTDRADKTILTPNKIEESNVDGIVRILAGEWNQNVRNERKSEGVGAKEQSNFDGHLLKGPGLERLSGQFRVGDRPMLSTDTRGDLKANGNTQNRDSQEQSQEQRACVGLYLVPDGIEGRLPISTLKDQLQALKQLKEEMKSALITWGSQVKQVFFKEAEEISVIQRAIKNHWNIPRHFYWLQVNGKHECQVTVWPQESSIVIKIRGLGAGPGGDTYGDPSSNWENEAYERRDTFSKGKMRLCISGRIFRLLDKWTFRYVYEEGHPSGN
jgi:hypothetical protein